MVNVLVNGLPLEVRKGITILQACTQAGIEIPRFCYHERLSIAGNCRMCLVEVEKSPKPVASCAMPVMDNMKIFTNTPLVKKAREGVLEFLLVNHPLDCPICDQGGECDLQDLTMAYGSDRGRFHEYKRGVEDKNIGPLVKTVMTRCIHCTRCVRFAAEIAGIPEIGTVGRGKDTEISTYIQKIFNSELSGNIIDLCPVGALTSKPYAFTARSWELQSTESIDVLDAVGSNIRIDVRGSEIMRVLPRLNEDVNEEWISDKARFSYDGLKRQRLNTPMVRENNTYRDVSWKDAFTYIKNNLDTFPNKNNLIGLVGNLADTETILLFKEFINNLGSDKIYTENTTQYLTLSENDKEQPIFSVEGDRSRYLLNTSLNSVEDSDVCLLIGTNPRMEAPILNIKIRKRYLQGNYKIASIGPSANLTYKYMDLGNSINILKEVCEGKHPFCKHLKNAKKPLIIVGTSILNRKDASTILKIITQISKYTSILSDSWNGFNILHTAASSVGALDLGIGLKRVHQVDTKKSLSTRHFIYLLNADEVIIENPDKHFIVYQGHHGDYGANIANVILPATAYTEKTATYVNTEGRVQQTHSAFFAPGDAREDWRIIRALSEVVGNTLPYNTTADIKNRFSIVAPHLLHLGSILNKKEMVNWEKISYTNQNEVIEDVPFKSYINNYYLTNTISRASQIMAKCSSLYNIN